MVGDPSRELCDHSRSPLTGESSRRTFATTSSFELWCFNLTEPGDKNNIVRLFLVKDLVYSYWSQRQNCTTFHGLNCLCCNANCVKWLGGTYPLNRGPILELSRNCSGAALQVEMQCLRSAPPNTAGISLSCGQSVNRDFMVVCEKISNGFHRGFDWKFWLNFHNRKDKQHKTIYRPVRILWTFDRLLIRIVSSLLPVANNE